MLTLTAFCKQDLSETHHLNTWAVQRAFVLLSKQKLFQWLTCQVKLYIRASVAPLAECSTGREEMVCNANCYFFPLPEEKLIADDLIVQAREAADEDLLVVHTRRYLNKLKVLYFMCFSTSCLQFLFKATHILLDLFWNQLLQNGLFDNIITERKHRTNSNLTLWRGKRIYQLLFRWPEMTF